MLRLALAALLALAPLAAPAEPFAFDRAQFGGVVLSRAQSGGIELEVATGAYRNESIRNYAPDSLLAEAGRAVGRLDVLTDAGLYPCTAFIVSPRHILTNHHCVTGLAERPEVGRIQALGFVAGYVEEGVMEGARIYQVAPVPVEEDARLDYAVLEVFGDPAATFGALPLSDRLPGTGDPFWVIGHPLGEAQRISREGCRAGRPALSDGRLLHGCDTLPGNSGSPVIDASGRGVVGLHHAGSRANSVNFAIPMARILEVSRILKAAAPSAPAASAPGIEARVCDALHEEARRRGGCDGLGAYLERCEAHPASAAARADLAAGRCEGAPAAPPEIPPAAFEILAGTDLPGGDLDALGLRGGSLSGCEASCEAEPGCAAFTYVSDMRWCWLKRAAGAPVPAPGMISGLRPGTDPAPRRSAGFARLRGVDLPGGDLTARGHRDVSLRRCEAICRTDPACAAYSYVAAKSWCWPKSRAGVRVPSRGIVSGVAR